MPRLSVSNPKARGPVSRICAPLLPPSRMVLTSMVISKPSHSANAALQTFGEHAGHFDLHGEVKGGERVDDRFVPWISHVVSTQFDDRHAVAHLHEADG